MKIDIFFLLKPTEMVEFYGEKKIGRGKYRKKSPWIRTPRTPKNTIEWGYTSQLCQYTGGYLKLFSDGITVGCRFVPYTSSETIR